MAVLQSTSITGGLTMHGMTAGFVKLNAEGAVVIDTNSYLISGSFLPLSGGTMSGKILAVSVGTGTYDGAIELRETGYASSGQSAWGYSPAITFHWGNRYAKRFGMRADGLFAVDDEPLALRSWVSSQGYVTGGPYLPLSGGNVTGRVEFQYAVDRYSQAWRNNSSGAYWWVTTDSDKLGYHRNGDGDKFYFSNGGDFWSSTNGWLSTALSGKLTSDGDSEQAVGLRYANWNEGSRRMNTDPRWNESGYDADLGCLHIWAWTAAGVAYGRAGIALYNGSAYQYLTTKASTTGMFINNTQIVTNSGTWGISITGNAATLGGYGPNQTGGANTIVQRDANGYIQNSYFYSSGGGSERNGSGLGYIAGFNSSDYYIRSYNSTAVASFLGLGSMAYASTANYIYTNSGNFTTAGTGWYRVATTGSDGRGTYYVEVYTTGGNHNPSYLKILAHGDWGNDKLVSVETDGGFPASSVRITRGASNTFLEVYFTTTILGASLRVNRFGFDSSVQIYTGALPSGGDTQQDIVSVYSKGYHTPGAVFAKTRMLVGGTDDNSGKADLSVDTGGTATIALAGQYFRVGDSDVNWDLAIRRNGNVETYGQALNLNTQAGNYAVNIRPNNTVVAQYYQDYTYFPGLDFSISRVNSAHASNYFRGSSSHLVIGTGGTLYLNYGNTSGTTYIDGTTYINSAVALHANNYNSYSPTLTGGGASGTWGINITGSAGSETLATVTGRGATTTSAVTFNAGITVNGTAYYTFSKPSTSSYQTVALFGTGAGGIFITSDNAIISKGAYYNNGWIATATAGSLIDLTANSNNPGIATFSGATVGSGVTFSATYKIWHEGNLTNLNQLTNGPGYITSSGSISGSAGSVPWSGVSTGYRTNYDLGFRPADNSSSYAGFRFATPGNDADAGYFLIRGGADSDVYTQDGITLVADKGWLTLAQRTTASKGVRIMTGTTSVTRLQIDSSGNTDVGLGAGTVTLYHGGASRFWTGSDGTRTQGWAYFQNTSQGLHWPGNNWHLHPASASDFIIRSGSNTDSALRFDTNGTTRGYVYAENDNTIGFLTNSRNWAFRTYSNGNALVYGYLTVNGAGTSSSIYMNDSDNGQREIHCNSNRIGFLNQSGNWGAWNDDNGNWGMSLNAYMAGNRFDIQGAEGQISFKDGDNVWTGYVGFTGNLGYLSFPGRNVKINSGYNGTITLETGVSGYNSGVVSIPYGRLTVDNSYIYAGTYVEAGSDMRAPIYYDSANTAYYGDFASTSRLNVLDANSIYTSGGLSTNGGNSLLGVQSPGGASRANGGSTETGAFKITLPSGIPVYGMFKLVIHIYEYGQRGNGYEIHCGGHMYPNYMYNRFQVQYGTANAPLNVRYGNDGTNGCIWIGDTNTTWSYPQIWVSEFMMGYSNTSWTTWRSGWNISLVTSYGNSGAMDGPYTCEYGYASSAGSASTSSQVTINYNDNSNANYQLLWGSGNNVYGTSLIYCNPSTDTIYSRALRGSDNVSGTGEATYHPAGIYSTGTNWLYGTMYLNGNTVYDADSFQLNGRYSIWGRWNTYSGYITKIAYMTFDYNSNNGHEIYHSIASTDINGSYSDAVSLNSYNDITLRLDSNNNNANSYLRISNNSAGDGTIAWIGYESGMNQNYFSGSVGISAGPRTDGYRLNMGGSIHLNGNSVDYVGSLYLQNGPGVHLQGNTDGSYGSLQITQTKNSWAGIYFTATGNTLMMNSNESGFYRQGYGWQWRWENGTAYVNKNGQGGGTSATVLDTSNFTTWAQPKVYQGQSDGNWQNFTNDVGEFRVDEVLNINAGGHSNQPPNVYTYGGVLSWRTNNHSFQLYASHTGDITFKTQWGNDNYSGWRRILHEANYNSWAPSLTGGGASGTWGISITGNADTVDGYHASNFLGYNGNSYYQVNTWLQMNGTHGIYWPSYNGAHFYVNTTSSYTQFRLDGSRGGYGGIWDSYSAVAGIMYDGSGNGGVYREANGRWYMYYHLGNDCMGIGTSSTNSGYSVYSNKGHFVNLSGSNVSGFYNYHSGGISSGAVVNAFTAEWTTYGASFNIVYKQGELSPSDMCHIYNQGGFYMKIFDGSSNRFHRWDDNGAVSINSSSQGSYTFNVTGDIYATADVIAFSDARVKEDVRTVENALDKVTKLRGVTYIKKDEDNKKRKMGVIAQEVLEVLPEVVHEDNDGYYGVSYGNIVGVLIEAIKEQQKQIDELKQELKNK
jgi:hypothetical protein